jgi:hypothetical protein
VTAAGDLPAIAVRIEELIHQLESGPDAEARRDAVELARLVLTLHGAGLARMLELLRAQKGGGVLLQTLAADPTVATLLSLHDLHPHAPEPAPLVQIARRSHEPVHTGVESCERCGTALASTHHHVVDLDSRRLSCACERCWSAAARDATTGRQRAVPGRSTPHPSLRLSDAEWEALQVPVGVAFFMMNSTIGRVLAFYPSPAGAVESLLPLQAWRSLVNANPWLESLAADVEALLVRRARDGSYDAAVVPIDACYDLIGRLRLQWRGFDGGDVVRREIDGLFTEQPAIHSVPVGG